MAYFHRKHVCIANISVMMTNSRSRSVPWTLLLATFALAIVIADPVLATMGGIDESEDSTSPHLTEAGLLELALDTDADAGADVDDDDDVDDEDDEQLGAQYLLDDPPASTFDKALCFASLFKDIASSIQSLACPEKIEECPKPKLEKCAQANVDLMNLIQTIAQLAADPYNLQKNFGAVTDVCKKGVGIAEECYPTCSDKTKSQRERLKSLCDVGGSIIKCTDMALSLQLNAKSSDMGSMQLIPAGQGARAAGTGTTAANTAAGKRVQAAGTGTAANTAVSKPNDSNKCKAPNGYTYPLSFANVCDDGCPQPGYCSEYCKCPSILKTISDALGAFSAVKKTIQALTKIPLPSNSGTSTSPTCEKFKAAVDILSCSLDTISFGRDVISGKIKMPSNMQELLDFMITPFANFVCNTDCGKATFGAIPSIAAACKVGGLAADLIKCQPTGNLIGVSLPTACQLTIEYGKPVGYEGCPFSIGEVSGCNSDGKGKSSDDVFIQCKKLVGQAAANVPECKDSIYNFFNWGVQVAPSCEPWPDAKCPTNQCRYSCLSDCVKSAIANRDSKCPLPAQQVIAYPAGDEKGTKCGQVVRPTKANECPKTAKFTGKCIPPPVWQYLGACQGAFGTKVDWSSATCCAAMPQWCTGSSYNILTPLDPPLSSEARTAITASLEMEGCNNWCKTPYPYGGDGKCGPYKSTKITCCNEAQGLNCYPFEKKCT